MYKHSKVNQNHIERYGQIIQQFLDSGLLIKEITVKLNSEGARTISGKLWTYSSCRKVLGAYNSTHKSVIDTEELIIDELINNNLDSSIQKIEDVMLILLAYTNGKSVARVSVISKAIYKDLRSEFPVQSLRNRLRTWSTLEKSLSEQQIASMLEELEDLRNDTTFCS